MPKGWGSYSLGGRRRPPVALRMRATSWFLRVPGGADWPLAVPILIAALCAAMLAYAAARRRPGVRSEVRIVVLGLLITTVLLAAGVYEVLLHELLFCARKPGDASAALQGARGAYCGLMDDSGYWPAFVPALAVLLASTVALERGACALVLTSVAAVAWSVVFGVLPLTLLGS